MSKEEEYIEYYEKGIKIYEKEEFKDVISEKRLLNIKNCYNEYLYWYNHSEWLHRIFRCKKSACPVCNLKNKAIKFYNFKDRAFELMKEYEVFCLTLNGNNVEIEIDKIIKEIDNNNKDLKKLLNRPFMKRIVREYFKVTEIKYTNYDSLPHIHIVLFVIKGIYKHFKINELRQLIIQEWRKSKGFNANVELKKVGTQKKLEKTINYLTIAKKKELGTLFYNHNILKIHLQIMNKKRFFIWSKKTDKNRIKSEKGGKNG